MSWLDDLKFDSRGLVPVVAQDAATGEVLMLAYADRAALERSVETGFAHYFSRSRGEQWKKGETSGHVQAVEEIRVDCDQDAVVYRVRQTGPACHTLERSCFHRRVEGEALDAAGSSGHILGRLEEIVRARQTERPEGSYTTYLFDKGLDKVLKKIGEESTEVVIAAKNGDREELRAEAADLLFHLLVALRIRELPLDEVWAVLEERFGTRSRIPPQRPTEHPHT